MTESQLVGVLEQVSGKSQKTTVKVNKFLQVMYRLTFKSGISSYVLRFI